MIKLKDLMSENTNIPSFKTGWDFIEYLDGIPSLKKYRNKNASYDDVYYDIPLTVLTKETGLSKRDLQNIDSSLESYEGSIDVSTNKVTVIGGS